MAETWKPIPGYGGKYEASDLGRVRSFARPSSPGHVLRQWIGLAKIKGSDVIYTEHKGRQIEVSISPKGSNVRVHVDGEEWKP